MNQGIALLLVTAGAVLKRITFAIAVWLSVASSGWAEPANTLSDVMASLTRCWRAPSGTTGSALTIAMALNRDGQLLGRPRFTYSRLRGDAEAQRRFVRSVLESLARCIPVRMTDTLAQAIAGRRFTIQFRSKLREWPA